MFALLARRLTFANVVSVLALFVALGGTGYAALTITGKNVANGTLTGADLKDRSVGSIDIKDGNLLAKDFKPGQLPAGAPGAQGPQGVQGVKGDPGATRVAVRAATGTGIVAASCLPGEVATGGGGHSADGIVIASAPVATPLALYAQGPIIYQGYAPTSWTARAIDDTGADANVTAWVVCAAP